MYSVQNSSARTTHSITITITRLRCEYTFQPKVPQTPTLLLPMKAAQCRARPSFLSKALLLAPFERRRLTISNKRGKKDVHFLCKQRPLIKDGLAGLSNGKGGGKALLLSKVKQNLSRKFSKFSLTEHFVFSNSLCT